MKPLTLREIDVLKLLAFGYTTKQIGIKIGISPRTAKNHIENIYNKMGVNCRVDAAMAGFALDHYTLIDVLQNLANKLKSQTLNN